MSSRSPGWSGNHARSRWAGDVRIEMPADDGFTDRAFSFLALSRAGAGFPELLDAFRALIEPVGFIHLAIIDMARSASNPVQGVHFSNFPAEWAESYIARRRDLDDPVWQATLSMRRAFRWSTLVAQGAPGRPEPFYREVGLADGFTIPVFSPMAARTVVLLAAGRMPAVDDNREAMIALCAGILASSVFRPAGDAAPVRPGESLTVREREVLTWTALGKSARDISLILGLSEKTVARHLLNIREKLGASNTVQAVALALREAMISL